MCKQSGDYCKTLPEPGHSSRVSTMKQERNERDERNCTGSRVHPVDFVELTFNLWSFTSSESIINPSNSRGIVKSR